MMLLSALAALIAASPAPPPAAKGPPPPPAERRAPASDWRFQPFVGFGFTQDFTIGKDTPQGDPATPQFVIGGELDWRASKDFSLALGVRDHLYHRRYLLTAPSAGFAPGAVETNEQMLDVELLGVHEILHHLTESGSAPFDGRLELDLRAGPAAHFFLNDVVPSNLSGISLGGEFRYALSPALSLQVSAAHLYKLFGSYSGAQLFYGVPKAALTLSGGVALGFSSGPKLRIGYQGEVLALDRGYRHFQAFTVTLDFAPQGGTR